MMIRPLPLLPSIFRLLLLLLALFGQPSSRAGPSSSAAVMALPVSMLNWNALSNFYPISALFRSSPSSSSSSSSSRGGEGEKAALALVVVVNEPSRPQKTASTGIVQLRPAAMSSVQVTRQDELPREAVPPHRAGIDGKTPQRKFGTLKLCPPGGRSFFEAFELACPMKKRRKKRHVMFGLGTRIRAEPPRMRKYHREEPAEEEEGRRNGEEEEEEKTESRQQQREERYRPANISEIMRICCVSGCEFADFFPHCGPFSMW